MIDSDVLIEAVGLSKHFQIKQKRGRSTKTIMAVDRVDLKVGRGRTLGIVGESGCGKSTLARLLVGLHVPTHGRVMFEGIDINDRDQAARNAGRKLQMVFQDPAASLNPRLRIGKSVAEPLYAMGIKDVAEPVNEMLSRVGLSPRYANRFPNELSGGQQQRVCIARALVGDAKLVIHDEAVSSLDVSLQAQVLRLLIELQDEFELTYVFISHDLAVVESVSDEIAVMYPRSNRGTSTAINNTGVAQAPLHSIAQVSGADSESQTGEEAGPDHPQGRRSGSCEPSVWLQLPYPVPHRAGNLFH